MKPPRTPPAPLDEARLGALALTYVARYATSSGKLSAYLGRKLRELGWAGDGEPPVDAVVQRCVALRYIDDEAFAESRAASLKRRGMGERRVRDGLRTAGLDAELAARSAAMDADEALAAALRFARKRRIGPYSQLVADDALMRRWQGQMMRAGHDYAITRRVFHLSLSDAEALEPS